MLPEWLPGIAPRFVSAPVQDLELRGVSRPGWSRWSLQNARITGEGFDIQLEGVAIVFDLAEQRVLSVRVDSTMVEVGELPSTEGGGGIEALPDLPSIDLPSIAFHYLPMQLKGDAALSLAADGVYRLTAAAAEGRIEMTGKLSQSLLDAQGEVELLAPLFARFDLPLAEPSLNGHFSVKAEQPLAMDPTQISGSGRFSVAAGVEAAGETYRIAANALRVRRENDWRVVAPEVNFVGSQGGGWEWQTPLDLRVTDALHGDLRLGEVLSARGEWSSFSGHVAAGTREFAVLDVFVDGLAGPLDADYVVSVSDGGDSWELIASNGVYGNGLNFDAVVTGFGSAIDLESTYALTLREPALFGWLGWQEAYDLNEGVLEGRLSGRSEGDKISYRVQGSLTDGMAHFEENVLQGVSAVVDVTGKGEEWHAVFDEVNVVEAHAGVVLHDVAMALDVTPERATVSRLAGRLLGGRVFVAEPFSYDLPGESARFALEFADIDLAELVALEKDDIEATGRVQGHLPIELAGDTVVIASGRIAATEAGVIRLSQTLSRSVDQPGIDFALRALENFSYKVLRGDIDYDTNGDLTAAIRLEGANPEIESGRPIHYNLNISENVPTLLKSLRLQDEVTRRLERKVIERGNE